MCECECVNDIYATVLLEDEDDESYNQFSASSSSKNVLGLEDEGGWRGRERKIDKKFIEGPFLR